VGDGEHLKKLAVAKAKSTKPRHQSGGAKPKDCSFYTYFTKHVTIIIYASFYRTGITHCQFAYMYAYGHLIDVCSAGAVSSERQDKGGYHIYICIYIYIYICR